MTKEREVTVEGIKYCVVISDEQEALLAAKAAGRAFVGVLPCGGEQTGGDVWTGNCGQSDTSAKWLWGAEYVVDSPETVDDRLLERLVRRKLGLPWVIAESARICIREFAVEDAAQVLCEKSEDNEDAVFYTPELLQAYIRSQYGFYEYGIWAVVRKSDGKIVGKAGISDCDARRWERDGISAEEGASVQNVVTEPEPWLELGYHIFSPYRRQGYAKEACRLILDYVEAEYDCPVYAAAGARNTASRHLLDKLGFHPCVADTGALPVKPFPAKRQGTDGTPAEHQKIRAQKYSESEFPPCLYVWNWR